MLKATTIIPAWTAGVVAGATAKIAGASNEVAIDTAARTALIVGGLISRTAPGVAAIAIGVQPPRPDTVARPRP